MRITDIQHFDAHCTACTACASVCPTHAIDMQADNEGFLYPVIREESCVHCGKCHTVCQLNQQDPQQECPPLAIAYGKHEEDRRTGSSGGVVYILSKNLLARGGIVYGAVFDPQTKTVHHTSSDVHSLEAISKSKYVQSALGSTFQNIQSDLENGREVLFCGTPCQVTGLKKFLKKDYPHLLTVDFMCHGVPSPGVFKDMLDYEEKKHGSPIVNVTFREKKAGWHKLKIRLYFQNGHVEEQLSADYPYYWYFLRNFSLRKSCYTCRKYNTHLSDLTVADFWQIDPKKDDDKGVSLVLKNTDKGAQYMEKIDELLSFYDETPIQNLSIYQHHYSTDNRTRFFAAYQQHGFAYICETMFPTEKKKYTRRLKMRNLQAAIKHAVQTITNHC